MAVFLLVAVVLADVLWLCWVISGLPTHDAPIREDEREVARFVGFRRCLLGFLLLLPIGLMLAVYAGGGAWWLAVAPPATGLLVFAVMGYEHRETGWYMRYQTERIRRGLEPRMWWDWRLG